MKTITELKNAGTKFKQERFKWDIGGVWVETQEFHDNFKYIKFKDYLERWAKKLNSKFDCDRFMVISKMVGNHKQYTLVELEG